MTGNIISKYNLYLFIYSSITPAKAEAPTFDPAGQHAKRDVVKVWTVIQERHIYIGTLKDQMGKK